MHSSNISRKMINFHSQFGHGSETTTASLYCWDTAGQNTAVISPYPMPMYHHICLGHTHAFKCFHSSWKKLGAHFYFLPSNTVNSEMFARTQFSLIFSKSLSRKCKVLANKQLQ